MGNPRVGKPAGVADEAPSDQTELQNHGLGRLSPARDHSGRASRFSERRSAMQPTHRVSPGRTRRRRAHQAIEMTAPTLCPLTGRPKMHHRACTESGFVRPGLVIRVPKLGIGVDKG